MDPKQTNIDAVISIPEIPYISLRTGTIISGQQDELVQGTVPLESAIYHDEVETGHERGFDKERQIVSHVPLTISGDLVH